MSEINSYSPTIDSARTRSAGARRYTDGRQRLGYMMIAPAVVVLLLLIAYPFILSIWLSFTDTRIAQEATGNFIGLGNYIELYDRTVFRNRVIPNTILYTVGAVPLKLALGMILALLLNRPFPLRTLVRGLILIPWVLPTSLSMVIFRWMFEPTLSVLNFMLEGIGGDPVLWLGTPQTALASVMAVNVWRGTPFFAVVLLAGLQGVPKDQLEAAEVDGATRWQRFVNVTIPTIFPIIVVATLFSVVRTFAEMEIVWVLTRGGPFNGTHMIGTYAYQQAIQNTRIGEGAAAALFFFPFLAFIMFIQLRYLQSRET
ncbi:MAG: sugar ABC transporter permease [Chloroflexi bacterium]|nr:sugar ABC transporter permease [Chloroflexota bacterium]